METTLLINYDDILHYTSISGNIDVYKINPHIQNAEILYLEPILGTDLYDKLKELVSSGTTISEPYYTLLNTYVIPSVVYHTIELFLPLNAFQVSDGGMFQHTATNSTTSAIDEIDKISNKYRIIGNKYDMKLSTYLCKNSSLFTEYISNTGLVHRTEVTARNGIYLGNRNSISKIRI